MIDTLLRALDLRTGRFTSPHVERMSERICDRRRAAQRRGVRARVQRRGAVHPPRRRVPRPTRCRSSRPSSGWRTPRSPTPRSTSPSSRSAWAASWDATNVADAAVAVVLPIAVDHAKYLGDTPADIAHREGRDHQARLDRGPRRAGARGRPRCCSARAAEVGATVVREGMEFGVVVAGAGGRRPDALAAGPAGEVRRRLPAAVRRPPGAERRRRAGRGRGLRRASSRSTRTLVRAAFAEVTSPGRLEIIRRSPTIVLDAAHNPHGAEATARGARGLVHVLPADRRDRRDGGQGPRGRAGGVRAAPRPPRSAPRTPPSARCPPSELADAAIEIFGEDRVTVAPRLADAIDQAATLAEAGEAFGDRARLRARCWSPARWSPSARPAALLTGRTSMSEAAEPRSPRRGMCAAVLCLEAITLGLTTPVMITIADVADRRPRWSSGSASPSPACCSPGCSAREWAYAARLGRSRSARSGSGFVIPMMFVLGADLRAAVGLGVLPRPQDRARAGRGLRRVRRRARLSSPARRLDQRGRARASSSSSVEPAEADDQPAEAGGAAVVGEQAARRSRRAARRLRAPASRAASGSSHGRVHAGDRPGELGVRRQRGRDPRARGRRTPGARSGPPCRRSRRAAATRNARCTGHDAASWVISRSG